MPRPHFSNKLRHLFDKPPDNCNRDVGTGDDLNFANRPKPKSLSAAQQRAITFLSAEYSEDVRLEAICDVVKKVLDGKPLPQGTIEQILDSISDVSFSESFRISSLRLLDQLVLRYGDVAPPSIVFNLLSGPTTLVELEIRLRILDNLSKNETDIGYFVTDFTSQLLSWLTVLLPTPDGAAPVDSPDASTRFSSASSTIPERHSSESDSELTEERRLSLMLYFLEVLRESIKRKTAYFQPEEMHAIVSSVTRLACNSSNVTETYECLDVIRNILSYDTVEREDDSLLHILTMLCFLSKNSNLVERVWQLLTLVLQTPLKFNAIQIMRRFLEDPAYSSVAVTRGAVSFLGLSAWGPQRIGSLLNSPSAILSSMQKAADREVNSKFPPGEKGVICYEILLQVRRLVEKFLESLQMIDCDLVVQILVSVGRLIQSHRSYVSKDLTETFHGIITFIEAYHEKKKHFHGAEEYFFYLVESHSKDRSEESINFLLEYRYKRIGPDKDRWLGTFRQLMTDHLLREARSGIRTKAVNIFKRIYTEYWFHYGDKIIDQVVKPCCDEMVNDRDYDVLTVFVDTILDICKDTARQDLFDDLVGFLRKVLNNQRILSRKNWNSQDVVDHFQFALRVVSSMVEIMESLWFSSRAAHAIIIHECLVQHLAEQYRAGLGSKSIADATVVRQLILTHILGIRCNATVHVGRLRGTEEADFSKFMIHCSPTGRSPPQSPAHRSDIHKPAVFDFSTGFDVLGLAILKERSFKNWKLVMEKLPKFLIFSKPIVCVVGEQKLETLALSLVKLSTDAPKSGLLFEAADPVSEADINDLIYPSLGPLVAYKSKFSPDCQRQLYQAIQAGLRSEKSIRAVLAITSCILELGPAIKKLIPELLSKLAQLPSTPAIAVPILEIFGVLVRYLTEHRPPLEENDYANVFVVLANYWNPFRFAPFIVAQAFHISCIWFACTPRKYRERGVVLVKATLHEVAAEMRISTDSGTCEIAGLHISAAYDFLCNHAFTDAPLEQLCRTAEMALLASAGRITAETWVYDDKLITIKMPVGHSEETEKYSPELPAPVLTEQEGASKLTDSVVNELPSTFDNMPLDRRRHFSEQVSASRSTPPSRKTSSARSRDDTATAVPKGKMQRIQSMDAISLTSTSSVTEPTLRDVMQSLVAASDIEPRWAIVEQRHACGLTQYVIDLAGNNSLSHSLFEGGRRVPNWLNPSLIFPSETAAPEEIEKRSAEITPSSLFMRLFLNVGSKLPSADFNEPAAHAVRIPPADAVKRIEYMDRILSPRIGRSIGVIFLGMGQKTEKEVLSNRYGSPRYERFIRGLGEMVHLPSYGVYGDESHDYVGGLATTGRDGDYAVVYEDTMSRIVFHVVTLMTANGKDQVDWKAVKAHIGNDFVTIVYNESNDVYQRNMIKSQFCYAAVEVRPIDDKLMAVSLRAKDEISRFLSLKDILVSDEAAPNLCRQMALRAELSSKMWSDENLGEPVYYSRPVERLREIRRVRSKFAPTGSGTNPSLGVFASFVP